MAGTPVGYFTGVPAIFIRLQGCPVGCAWCDTKHTWDKLADRGFRQDAEQRHFPIGQFVPGMLGVTPRASYRASLQAFITLNRDDYAVPD
jgi:pyruvate-formate lyase-activating enzyme